MGGGTREQEVRVAPHEDWQASGSIARAKWPQGLCPQHGAGGGGGGVLLSLRKASAQGSWEIPELTRTKALSLILFREGNSVPFFHDAKLCLACLRPRGMH